MTTPRAEKDIAERPRQTLQDEMSDVRRLIDELDEELVALLAKRQRQIERAARIKPALGIPANVPERVDEVLAHVLGAARREGLSVEVAMNLWRTLIDWSIQYEERLMGDRAPKGDFSRIRRRRRVFLIAAARLAFDPDETVADRPAQDLQRPPMESPRQPVSAPRVRGEDRETQGEHPNPEDGERRKNGSAEDQADADRNAYVAGRAAHTTDNVFPAGAFRVPVLGHLARLSSSARRPFRSCEAWFIWNAQV